MMIPSSTIHFFKIYTQSVWIWLSAKEWPPCGVCHWIDSVAEMAEMAGNTRIIIASWLFWRVAIPTSPSRVHHKISRPQFQKIWEEKLRIQRLFKRLRAISAKKICVIQFLENPNCCYKKLFYNCTHLYTFIHICTHFYLHSITIQSLEKTPWEKVHHVSLKSTNIKSNTCSQTHVPTS